MHLPTSVSRYGYVREHAAAIVIAAHVIFLVLLVGGFMLFPTPNPPPTLSFWSRDFKGWPAIVGGMGDDVVVNSYDHLSAINRRGETVWSTKTEGLSLNWNPATTAVDSRAVYGVHGVDFKPDEILSYTKDGLRWRLTLPAGDTTVSSMVLMHNALYAVTSYEPYASPVFHLLRIDPETSAAAEISLAPLGIDHHLEYPEVHPYGTGFAILYRGSADADYQLAQFYDWQGSLLHSLAIKDGSRLHGKPLVAVLSDGRIALGDWYHRAITVLKQDGTVAWISGLEGVEGVKATPGGGIVVQTSVFGLAVFDPSGNQTAVISIPGTVRGTPGMDIRLWQTAHNVDKSGNIIVAQEFRSTESNNLSVIKSRVIITMFNAEGLLGESVRLDNQMLTTSESPFKPASPLILTGDRVCILLTNDLYAPLKLASSSLFSLVLKH